MAPAVPKKPPREPKVPMRKLNWTKLPDLKVKDTVWEREAVDDREAAALDLAELEATFGTKAPSAPKGGGDEEDGGGGKGRQSMPKFEKVALVDPKRAQAISNVMGNLRMMKLDGDMVIDALKNARLDSLTNARMPIEMVLSLLQSTMPLPEEVEMLDGYDGDRLLLRDVEQWLYRCKEELPSFDKRTQALVARASFSTTLHEEMAVMRRVYETAKQIRESDCLTRVLAKTLALGNYLNGTSRQGGAYGFKLAGLMELTGCKSIDGKMTLLHYLAKTTATQGRGNVPLVEQLKGELSAFDDPVRFEWATVSSEVAKMGKSIKLIKELVATDKVEAFQESMSAFLTTAEKEMAELDELADKTNKLCLELGVWFAEQKVDKEPEKFFSLIGGFVKALELADKFNRESKEREEKKRQRALLAASEAEARKEAAANAKANPGGAGGLKDATNVKVANALAGLHAAKPRQTKLVDQVVEGMAVGRVRRHG